MTYTVKAGDTLGTIAARNLGSSSRYKEILTLNPQIKNPNLIAVGQVIKLPTKGMSPASSFATGSTYTISSGLSSLPKVNTKMLAVSAVLLLGAYYYSKRKQLV